MRCEELRGLLDLHLDGELPEEMARRLERHLLRCLACAYEARALEQTRVLLREAVPAAQSSPGYRERAVARLQSALAAHLRSAETPESGRQWTLPFSERGA